MSGLAAGPAATTVVVPETAAAPEVRVRPAHVRPPADRLFRGAARGSGFVVLTMMTMVGLFLALRAQSALAADGSKFLTTQAWDPESHDFGIAGVLTGSVLIALTAIFFALPLALGTSLFISEYAPVKMKKALIAVVDLMAAIPSVVFGLWGFFFFEHSSVGVTRWISKYLGWVPLLHLRVDTGEDSANPLASTSYYTGSTFIAGVVVALMVTPIACSVMREAFSQAPLGEREGAYALGATRWGMVRNVVLPFGRGGIIGGTMLGLGRALGETIAVYMVISMTFKIQGHILGKGGSSVSSLIAQRYGASSSFAISALMAAGLALFLMTLVVNFGASMIVARSRSGAESEA
ncbi:phosphate ABC transporter permease subunit PstC [Catenulispora yoronensis]|uniref:Phosphate transport system permease protein n=1 Tax=Catenulispora yoronensis TaxID=450799 RepID=A0ABP5G942_9ACTN